MKIDIIKVEFHSMPDLIYSLTQWHSFGGYKQMLKDNCISISWIKRVVRAKMNESDFFKLNAWEG